MLYAVRLPALLTPEVQAGCIFIGVSCPRCNVAYSVSLPNSSNNAEAIPAAIEWAEANIGQCGAHPAVIYEDEQLGTGLTA